jgi:hypothetical protein
MKKQAAFGLIATSLLFLGATSFSQIHISGPQSGTLIDTTYIVDDSISVEQGESLIIEPGAVFLFDGYYPFQIRGILEAIGTETDSIIFRPNSGIIAWRGIKFSYESSDSCILRYCLVEGSNDQGIHLRCGLTIDHCTIRGNKGGEWGGGIYVSASSSRHPVISNCLITENGGSVGGGIGVFPGNVTITNCIITKNRSQVEGGGINLEMSGCRAIIDHCLIAQNTSNRGGGIYLCTGAKADIINCTVVGNSSDPGEGGGIGIGGYSTARIVNTIAAYNMGGGIDFRNINSRLKYSCIFHNSGADFTGDVPNSIGLLVMVNANGDSCDIYRNITANPLFVDLSNHDYHLQATSPCIDAGNPNSPLDPDGTIADIGAFYYDQGLIDNVISQPTQPEEYQLLSNYPNPFNAITVIRYYISNTGSIQLSIYNILGQRVATLFDGDQQAGEHSAIWNAADIPSGIYFAQFKSATNVEMVKMVLLK